VECRSDDEETIARLAAIEHAPSRLAVDAERSFLAHLGGGCDLPVGAHYDVERESLIGMVATLDGRIVLRDHVHGRDPEVLGRELADRLLTGAAGASLLEDLRGTPV
jgi:hydroxymethylbilane synthase